MLIIIIIIQRCELYIFLNTVQISCCIFEDSLISYCYVMFICPCVWCICCGRTCCYNGAEDHMSRAALLLFLLCLEFGVKGRKIFMGFRASVRIVGFKGRQRQSRKESQQASRARRRLSSSMLMVNVLSHTTTRCV